MRPRPSSLQRIADQGAPTARYERPVDARLVVRLANDEEWDATPEDLRRFGLVDSGVVAAAAIDLQQRLDIDLERHDHGATPAGLDPDRIRTAWLTYRLLGEAVSSGEIDEEWAEDLSALLHVPSASEVEDGE